jgi:hypothetical protein
MDHYSAVLHQRDKLSLNKDNKTTHSLHKVTRLALR